MIRTGLLGCGKWGKNIAKTIGGLIGVELSIVCDADFDTAEKLGVSVARDEVELVSNSDVVFIATPASMHYAHAKWALESGKPVFLEKPLALNPEQGHELMQMAVEHDIPFCIDHEYLYHPAVDWMMQNREMTGFPYQFTGRRLNRGTKRSDVDVTLNAMVHDVSVIFELFSSVELVSAYSYSTGCNPGERADYSTAMFAGDSGYAVTSTTWAHPSKIRDWDILFEKGHLFVDDVAWLARWTPYANTVYDSVVNGEYRFGDAMNLDIWGAFPLTESIKAFLKWVKTEEEPVSSVRNQIAVYDALWRFACSN